MYKEYERGRKKLELYQYISRWMNVLVITTWGIAVVFSSTLSFHEMFTVAFVLFIISAIISMVCIPVAFYFTWFSYKHFRKCDETYLKYLMDFAKNLPPPTPPANLSPKINRKNPK